MKSMSGSTKLALLVFCVIAIGLRFVDNMNLQAVGALALFCGAVVSPLWLALIIPVAVMMVSDVGLRFVDPLIPGVHWPTACLVYSSFVLAALVGRVLIRGWRERKFANSEIQIGAATLAGAILFFLVTNFGAWLMMPEVYERSLRGIVDCYMAAIPFFRNSLIGDTVFVCIFFGSYAWLASRAGSQVPQLAEENSL